MKAIIWDMDGTITDTEKYWSLLPFRLLEAHGVPDPRGDAAPWYLRSSYRASLANYLSAPDCPLHMSVDEAIIWCKNYIYTHVYPLGAPLKPHARDTLEAARALNVPMCLLSATAGQPLHYTLYKLDLLPYFTFWQTTCDQPLNKHHTALFERSAQRMGVAARDCLVVEDSLYSMKTAKRAGCAVWAIADPKHKLDKPEILATADRYFEDHLQLARAFKEDFA